MMFARRRAPSRAFVGATLACLGSLTGASVAATSASYSALTVNDANTFAARPDTTPPEVTGAAFISRSDTLEGYVRPGGGFRVYANAEDAGIPSTGVSSVTANLSALTPGMTAASLDCRPGSAACAGWTTAPLTAGYTWRSPQATASASLAQGQHNYSLTATDGAGNSKTATGFTVLVDATPPTVHRSVLGQVSNETFRIYAQVTEPPVAGQSGSGIDQVLADVSFWIPGAPMVPVDEIGSWTVNGQTYNRRTDVLTKVIDWNWGSSSHSVQAIDRVGNATDPAWFKTEEEPST